MEIRQRSRECNEGTEVDFQWIQWRVPNDPNDTNDPCHDLHDAYLSSSPNQDLFLRDLYNSALKANTDYLFNRNYTFDSLNVIVHPTDPVLRKKLTDRQCPDGHMVFRVMHAKCMIAIVRSYTEERTRRKDRLTPNGLMSVTDGPVDFNKVRYAPCDAQTSYCCTRQYKICRDTGTNANHYQIVYTPSSQNECPSTFDTTLAHPPIAQDESVVGVCNEYCQQGEEPPKSRDDEHGSMNLGVLPVDKAGTP